MGNVDFGARTIEHEGREIHSPVITITMSDGTQINFNSDIYLETVEHVEDFCGFLYQILTGPKDPKKVYHYPGGSSREPGHQH